MCIRGQHNDGKTLHLYFDKNPLDVSHLKHESKQDGKTLEGTELQQYSSCSLYAHIM